MMGGEVMPRGWYIHAGDSKKMFYYRWKPEEEDRIIGSVQIIHGMAEHAARYDYLGSRLAEAGFAVYAQDLRGHGKTMEDEGEIGFFAEQDGWNRVTEDINEIGQKIAEEQPDVPLFLLGHSMGSFLARTIMIDNPERYSGVILSGTAGNPGFMGKVGKVIAIRNIRKYGVCHKDRLLDRLSFGSYNRSFRPNRSAYDWLSSDEDQVDAYIDDPLCGFVCTSAFFRDLLDGLIRIHNRKLLASMPKELPVLLVSGERDPVGKMGRGPREVYRTFRSLGMQDVTLRLFPHMRHEILNEIDRDLAIEVVISWLRTHIVR